MHPIKTSSRSGGVVDVHGNGNHSFAILEAKIVSCDENLRKRKNDDNAHI